MNQLHLTDEQLSLLVEGAIGDAERALLEEHLHTCRSCFAAWQDALLYRGIWEMDPSIFRASASVAAIAHETPLRASSGSETRATRASTVPSRAVSWWRAWAPVAVTAAAVVTLLAALAVWSPDMFRPGQSQYANLFVPVKAAVEEASTGGSITIPGAEAIAATTPALRAGYATPSAAVSKALQDLAEAYRDDRTPPEVAHWLVSGFLAVGELDNARLYSEDARRRYPGDRRFVVLEAIVAYRSDDVKRAERLLQVALQTDPHDGVALLNLGLVQYEQGKFELARQTFQTVRDTFQGSPLEMRAATLLSELL